MERKQELAAGLAAGALLGALAGVLLAPKSGKATRDDLVKFMRSSSKKVVSQAKRLKDLTQDKYDEIVERVVETAGKTTKMGKQELAEWKETLKGKYADVKHHAAAKKPVKR